MKELGADLRLSVTLTGDTEIHALNRRYLGHDHPTDVLAFPLGPSQHPDDFDGEIVVSVERAIAEARARSHDWQAELALYLVHGVLHLCGFDDHAAATRRLIITTERAILAKLNVVITYRE
jgi:probable rRNA maturation factor